MKKFLTSNLTRIVSALIISIVIIVMIVNRNRQTLSIECSQLWVNLPKEMIFLCDNQEIYRISLEIKEFVEGNFLEYSTVNYPRIEFSDGEMDEKINQMFYEMAMLHYDEELENEINAFYSCDFFITFANEDYICIYFVESISAGMSSVTTYEDAITISLKTGDKVSLDNFEDIDTILKKVDRYKGPIYTDVFFSVEDWEKNKKELIEQWKENNVSKYYGYYLYDGRLGILFDYYKTGRIKAGLEFQEIINY